MNAAQTKTTAVTRADRTFADAWYNLSDLLDEQGRVEAATERLFSRVEFQQTVEASPGAPA